MPSFDVPAHLTFEMTQVARYHAFEETAQGISVPNPGSGEDDCHFEFPLPGAVGFPAVLFYRTRRFGTPEFTVRINSAHVTIYTFTDDDVDERTWHEIIPSNQLQAGGNELVLAVSGEGSVVFGDVVLLYTSNQTTVSIPVVATAQ